MIPQVDGDELIADRPIGRAVALGGGHGLAASLAALRAVAGHITAVVTVADDGGSSGRIRRELPVLPPGDLRMAVAALAGADDWHQLLATALQHRFGGNGALAGHSVGNLLLTGLTEVMDDDPVAALRALGHLTGGVGDVLPMSTKPLEIAALVEGINVDHPADIRRIRGQVAVATTPGRVRSVELVPTDPPACPEACLAIAAADVVVLGPGSWFTSVIPHLLVPDLRVALEQSPARRVLALNLAPQPGETDNFSVDQLVEVFCAHAPDMQLDAVIADVDAVVDRRSLERVCADVGAALVLAPLAAPDGSPRHDPSLLAEAVVEAARSGR